MEIGFRVMVFDVACCEGNIMAYQFIHVVAIGGEKGFQDEP